MISSYCADEKIRIPGKFQDFAYLIGLDADGIIHFYSENLKKLFPTEHEILSKSIDVIPILSHWLKNYFLHKNEIEDSIDTLVIENIEYYIYVLENESFQYIQIEEKIENAEEYNLNFIKIDEYESLTKKSDLWNKLVQDIYQFTKYDRIMVYQFLADGSGKVIAERTIDQIESYLNLHYPEEDIPSQARELYLTQKRRIFSDIDAPHHIIHSTTTEVDLTYCEARAMSPLHGQYLRNSGVKSSFSTSIIVENKLWGLVTCQNIEAKHVDLKNRIYAERLTNWASKLFTIFNYKAINKYSLALEENIQILKTKLLTYPDLKVGIKSNFNDFLKLAAADGVAYINKDEIIFDGMTPSPSKINEILVWYRENHPAENKTFIDRSFAKKHPTLVDNSSETSGIIISEINREDYKYFIWFRKEYNEHIQWAGNPEKEIIKTEINGIEQNVISPRASFKKFKQEIKGQSKIWSRKNEIAIHKLQNLLYEITFNHFDKIQELNHQLVKINDELDSFASTISHDLGTPLTVSKLNLQLLLTKVRENESQKTTLKTVLGQIETMEELMKNILDLSRSSKVDLNFEKINMHHLIKNILEDVLTVYSNQNIQVECGELHFIHSDKTLIYQVFQNLISNAVKYSSKETVPKIKIESEVSDNFITYSIIDNGIGIPEHEISNLFKIFKRLDNATSYKGNGVGLSIVKKILDRLEATCDVCNNDDKGITFKLHFIK